MKEMNIVFEMKEMNIVFEISRNNLGEITISTTSKYAELGDKRIMLYSYNLYDKMEALANKYNNHRNGCFSVEFTIV